MLTKDNKLFYGTNTEKIDSDFVMEQLGGFIAGQKTDISGAGQYQIHQSKKE